MFCPNCGGEFTSPREGLCPHCGHAVSAPTRPGGAPSGGGSSAGAGDGGGAGGSSPPPSRGAGAPPPPSPPGGGGDEVPYCPFEDPSLGFFDGLVETIKQVFASPAPFFRKLPDTSDIGKPVLFFILLSIVGALFQAFWGLIMAPFGASPEEVRQAMEQADMPPEMIDLVVRFSGAEGVLAQSLVNVVMAPILGLIGLFILTAIYHLLLMLFGGANRGYGATFRVGAYTSAVGLLYAVPICGGPIFALWSLVLHIVGLCFAHRTDGWRALLAVLLLYILCCLCCFGGMFGIIGMAGVAAQNAP